MTSNAKIIERIACTIRELRDRIKNHRDHIKAHETRTRVVLVDPLLRSRGWDPEDPQLVHHEYKVKQGWADYALMRGDSVVAIIEAKKLDQKFTAAALVKKVAAFPGLDLIVFTNGNEWQFFRAPNFEPKQVKVDSAGDFKTAFQFHEELPNPDPPVAWYPLCGELPDSTPTWVRMGEAAPTEFQTWKQLYVDVAKYLVSSGGIRSSNLPVYAAKGKKWAIHHKPEGPDGKPFFVPVMIADDMWLEALGGKVTIRDYSCNLLRQFHSNPESVQLRFD